jgi:hypothetical protein
VISILNILGHFSAFQPLNSSPTLTGSVVTGFWTGKGRKLFLQKKIARSKG